MKNITFDKVDIKASEAKARGVVIGETGDTNRTTSIKLEDVSVNGNVIAKDKAAGLIGYAKYVKTITVSNCHVAANISATATTTDSYRAGGLFGYMSVHASVTIENCSYSGKVSANEKGGDSWAGVISAGIASDVKIKVIAFECKAGSSTTEHKTGKYGSSGALLNGGVIWVSSSAAIGDTDITLTNNSFSFNSKEGTADYGVSTTNN